MSNKKKISLFSVIEVIVIILLALMIIGMITCNILFKNDGTATPFLGMTIYKTKAVNMIPEIPVNTVIIAKKSEIESIRERSVILCKIGDRVALTRVVRIDNEDGSLFYVVKFDTSPSTETFRIDSEAVIAKAVWQMESFGKFLDFATSTVGIILAVIIPLFFIIIFQVVRIVNIRKLEEEASSSLDDIDELILSRDADAEEPSPVTFTEPKFIEDITGKIKIPSKENYYDTYRQKADPIPEPSLSFDRNGKVVYSVQQEQTVKPEADNEAALFTYDRLPKKTNRQLKKAVHAGIGNSSTGEIYINKPTKIEPSEPKLKADEFFINHSPGAVMKNAGSREEQIVFTPNISNVIPERIASVQAEAYAPKQTAFNDNMKSYYEKPEAPAAAPVPEKKTEVTEQVRTIPENAVLPKETLAPPKKKKSSRTLDELMSIIDAEESKLRK